MTNEMLVVAIRAYFRGERHEMLAILVGALALLLLAIGLYAAMRQGIRGGRPRVDPLARGDRGVAATA